MNLTFHGRGNSVIFKPFYTFKGEFAVPWGWEFWYLPIIVHGNFDIFLPLYTLKGYLKFHGGGIFFISSYHCTHSRSIWSSTGVEILISSYHCTHSRSIWSSMGVGILISSEHCTHSKVNLKFHGRAFFSYLLPTIVHTQWWIWSSMGVGLLISSYHCTLKGQCEVPWGWEFRRLLNYHCTHAKVNLKVHEGGNFGIFLPLHKLKVNLKLHGGGNFDIFLPLHTQTSIWSSIGAGNLISSYWCTHSMSIWSSIVVGIFISSYHCTHSKVYLKFHGVGFLISSYHCTHSRSIWNSTGLGFGCFLPLYTFKVNLKFMGFPKGRHAIIGRACGVAQSGDPRCTSGVAQYGKLRIYNRAGAESQLDIQCIRKGHGVQWMLNVMLYGLRWK